MEGSGGKDKGARWFFVSSPKRYFTERILKDPETIWNTNKQSVALKLMREDIKPGDRVLLYAAAPDKHVVGELELSRK